MSDKAPEVATSKDLRCVVAVSGDVYGIDRIDELEYRLAAIEQDAELKEAIDAVAWMESYDVTQLSHSERRQLAMRRAILSLIPTLSQRPETPN